MGERTKLGLGILGGAVALGVLGDGLLRATPWGINLLLWVLALVFCGIVLVRWSGTRMAGGGRWMAPVAVLFAAGVAWRDSPTLVFLDVLAVLISLSLALSHGRAGSLKEAGISGYALGGARAGVFTAAGPLPVAAREVRWDEVMRWRWRTPALAVARGVFIAAPLLIVFGGLFVAADAVFEAWVLDLFGFDLAEAFGHAALFACFFWLASGAFWVVLMARATGSPEVPRPAGVSLGILEVGVVLGLLNALFLAFVVAQVRYLFGGAATVDASAGITYSEYARRGFFELVAVTALVLPLLLAAHWLLRDDGRAAFRIFRALAGTLISLLLVIMASALQRMHLYTREFGLTELRLYATVFMAWILVVLFWFVATVLRGRRDRFAFGALVSGFAAILLLNAANPDARIVHTNVARLEAGAEFDAYYLSTLSADAVPALIESLPVMDEPDRRIVTDALRSRWAVEDRPDWRTWNLGRSRALEMVERYRRPPSTNINSP